MFVLIFKMKFSRVIFAFFFFLVLHLSFLVVNGSVIQRSLSDDIKNGISIAGKIFGIDSPSNIAAVSNIADLVARAFSNNNNNNYNNNNFNNGQNNYNDYKQDGWHHKQMFEKRPTEKLESFSVDEVPLNQHHHGSPEETIDDNVVVGNGYSTSTQTAMGENGILGQVFRILGMDTSKIGAMALNGIIFIAQMIGRSFMSAFTGTTETQKIPNENILGTRNAAENYKTEQPRALPIIENAFDWILDQSKKNPFLSQQMNAMLDKELPERILNYIDEGVDENREMQTDCMKMLICKSAPIIQGMQRAVAKQINGEQSETIEPDENSSNIDPKNGDSQMNAFFKHLPSVDEFRDYGETCEDRFKLCKIF